MIKMRFLEVRWRRSQESTGKWWNFSHFWSKSAKSFEKSA